MAAQTVWTFVRVYAANLAIHTLSPPKIFLDMPLCGVTE